MAQVLVAAWVGITVGWIGFGWVLAEAPGEGFGDGVIAAHDMTPSLQNELRLGGLKEPSTRS